MAYVPDSFCFICGRPRGPDEYGCPACGGDVYAPEVPGDAARREPDAIPVRGPLAHALARVQPGIVLLAGPRGAGKSTLALGTPAAPPRVVSPEMGAELARSYAERLGLSIEAYRATLDIEAPDLGLAPPVPRYLVLDSLQAHPTDPIETIAALKRWAIGAGALVFVTSQVTKEGRIAGFERVPHDADVVVELAPAGAVNRATVTKNRFGAQDSVLWSFGSAFDGGALVDWGRRYYSIEGSPPELRAVPFPTPGARHAGYLAAAAADPELRELLGPPPCAVSAVDAGGLYPDDGRWIEPHDGAARRDWAKRHGLRYFSPQGA